MATVSDALGAAGRTAHIELQRMPHELHLRNADEDWAGITDQKARKRLQNRLNKRISRNRKRGRKSASPDTACTALSTPTATLRSSPEAYSVISASSPSPCASDSLASLPSSSPNSPAWRDTSADARHGTEVSFGECSAATVPYKRAVLSRFAEHALRSYATADPCADHSLRLIQLNIINGLTRNALALGFSFDWLACEMVSPFGREAHTSPKRLPEAAVPASLPPSLAPTSLQLQTRHHPWADLFPVPALRNNLLLAAQLLAPEDEMELYQDVLESGGGKREWAGLVVWGDPWDPQNWEVSLPFLRRWGWVLGGCSEILQATNRWRAKRGEEPIETRVSEI